MQTDLKNVYPYKLRLEDDHCGSFVHLVAITSQALIAIVEVQIGLLNYCSVWNEYVKNFYTDLFESVNHSFCYSPSEDNLE